MSLTDRVNDHAETQTNTLTRSAEFFLSGTLDYLIGTADELSRHQSKARIMIYPDPQGKREEFLYYAGACLGVAGSVIGLGLIAPFLGTSDLLTRVLNGALGSYDHATSTYNARAFASRSVGLIGILRPFAENLYHAVQARLGTEKKPSS